MSSWIMIAAAAQPAAAQEAVAVQPPAAPERGVIAYPPAFFAEAAPVNAYDMVVRLPGFTFDKGQTVRGLAGSGGNVLIDGAPPVSKNDPLDEILKRIPAGAVERVEVIRGGAPGIDMEGRTVMANVVRKQTGGFRGAVMPGSYFVYDGRTLTGIRAEAQWRWAGGRSGELAQVYGRGPSDDLGDGIRTRYGPDGRVILRSDVDADGHGLRQWTTGAYETPFAGGRARFNGAFMLTPASVEIYDRIRGGGLEYEYDNIKRLQAELGGRYSRTITAALSVEAVAFQQWNNNRTTVHFEAPGLVRDFRLEKETTETVGRLHFRLRHSPELSLEAGIEGALNRLDSETDLAVNGRAVFIPAANVQVEETRGEVFARGTWRPNPRLTLEAGVRQEGSTVTTEGDLSLEKTLTYTKPRLAMTWAPDAATQVRARIEREVGQLNFDDFVASQSVGSLGVIVAGNPNLKPQQAWVAEAAYERRFLGSAAVVLTARHYEIRDTVDRGPARFDEGPRRGEIILDPVTGLPVADRPENIGKGTKDELQASLTLPLDRIFIRAAQFKAQATWRRTEVTDPVTGEEREISLVHPVDWEAHFSQDLPAWKSTWGIDASGGFRERAYRLSEVETKKQSTWVVVYGEYKPRPDWIIRLEAQGASMRNVKRIREVYRGVRDPSRLNFIDVRDLEWGGSLYLRVRKVFG
ncbi:TonB-dependent receptor plug domain-containing protein [Phenylobacterium sp.]|uniref:TonB-dependent receptor plug domain-containing protein n=1 Tax=Phenylobacterium sp. TaxID=1871053 RepID=UPI002CFFD9A4|nr:TonB-dependent receptor [Phenylobacterium sp.]HVI33532.1 TonB-dependent receptor [Phenylobacterium sp.]